MSAALSRSSPNCPRIENSMPVLLFLQLGWDLTQACKVPPLKPAGASGCGRILPRLHHFFRADPSPWSNSLDFPPLPPKTIGWCSSFSSGRQAEGDWGYGGKFHQNFWGDDWKGMRVNLVHIANNFRTLTMIGNLHWMNCHHFSIILV